MLFAIASKAVRSRRYLLQLAAIARHPLSLVPLFAFRNQWRTRFRIGKLTLGARRCDLGAVAEIGIHDEYGFIRKLAFPDPALVLDLGANIGCFSALVFSVRDDAEVHSVEPSPDTSALLEQNRERYPNLRWTTHRIAIATHDGTGSFSDYGPSTARKLAEGEGVPVKTESFDNFVGRIAGARRVFLCKMDIEGAEIPIFATGSGVLDRIDHFVVEVHGPPDNARLVKAALSAAYPRLEVVEGRRSMKPVFHAWRS
jgi:FkbM family methyltransferase